MFPVIEVNSPMVNCLNRVLAFRKRTFFPRQAHECSTAVGCPSLRRWRIVVENFSTTVAATLAISADDRPDKAGALRIHRANHGRADPRQQRERQANALDCSNRPQRSIPHSRWALQ